MKSSELVMAQLPNGFHDAVLSDLLVDLASAAVHLHMAFWTGGSEGATEEEREARRVGVLHLSGVTSVLIWPPAEGYEFTNGSGVDVDGGVGGWPDDPAPPDDGLVRFWFWVSTWNSRMLFTAKSCQLEWKT